MDTGAMLAAKLADSDDKDGTWNWNQAAPGMDVNMLEPTVRKYDENIWVHIDDYQRGKRE